jgi:hypothetical protein
MAYTSGSGYNQPEPGRSGLDAVYGQRNFDRSRYSRDGWSMPLRAFLPQHRGLDTTLSRYRQSLWLSVTDLVRIETRQLGSVCTDATAKPSRVRQIDFCQMEELLVTPQLHLFDRLNGSVFLFLRVGVRCRIRVDPERISSVWTAFCNKS